MTRFPLLASGEEEAKGARTPPPVTEGGIMMPESVVTVGLRGDLSFAEADEASREIAAASPWVIVDLSKVEFMDCAGLSVLLRARSHYESLGGWLILASPGRTVLRLLDILEAWRHFLIWDI